MKTNYDNYSIEYSRPGPHKWIVSRPNYDRRGNWSSDTLWVYYSDSSLDYDDYRSSRISRAQFIRRIKSNPRTLCINSRLYYKFPYSYSK